MRHCFRITCVKTKPSSTPGAPPSWHSCVIHIETSETYRLSAADLECADLLPEKPGWMEQEEYEQRTRVGFNLERVVKSIDGLAVATAAFQRHADSERDGLGALGETFIEDTDTFRTTRIDVEDGPDIIKIERK